MKKAFAPLLLAVAAFATISLVSGADYLGLALPGGLPLGNALTAIGLCAFAGAAFALSRRGTALRIASLTALTAAVAWLPVSMWLAGNAALNFPAARGDIWLAFSLAVVACVFATLAWAGVATLLALRMRRRAG